MVTAASRETETPQHGAQSVRAKRRPAAAAPPNRTWTGLALGARTVPVSHPGDPSEREADRIADRIVQSPAPRITESPSAPVQRRAVDTAPAPSISSAGVAARLGSGTALDAPTRKWFEPRIGADLSAVRIHTDATAERAADDFSAHAFAVGPHIAFSAGQYSPDTAPGRRLLAHELVHVLQGGHTVHRSAVSAGDVKPTEVPRSGEGQNPPLSGVYVPASTPRKSPPVPSPETCPPPKDMACPPATSPSGAVTKTFIFAQDSAALDATQKKDVDAAAKSWHTSGGTMTVRIDGFASAEGQCEYNWNLSCRRAQAVRSEIESPTDKSAGVPGGSVEIFAHGESNDAGPALAGNRRATISIPVPPPPPPAPTLPTCAFPVALGSGRGCGTGTDFTHFDFPSISTGSEAKLAAWAAVKNTGHLPFRSMVSDGDCEIEMDAVLMASAGGAGHAAFARFVAGTGGTESLGPGTTLGTMALTAPSFLATVRAVKSLIEAQLAAQAAGGALNACALAVSPPPQTHFSLGGPDPVPLQGVIGGTHGERLFATGFTGSVAARTYSIDLRFLICDNFGVDEHDLYFFGLMPFWVLQHERSASLYAPFINELDLNVTVSGTF